MITTVSAVLFFALVIAMLAGWLNNPYAGLIVFVALPAVFVIGLLLIPMGVRLQRRKLQRDPSADVDWPVLDFRRAEVRRTSLVILALTAVNIVIVLLAGYGTLHWMESPSFCGQACHTPMHPQFTALQNASHARVACVDCHIGEGARGFVYAKLSGVRQLFTWPPTRFQGRSRRARRCRPAPRPKPAPNATSQGALSEIGSA